jgi:predicted ATPase
MSSLTRDSSLRSLDPLKIEISDLTHLFGRTREQEILQTAFVRVLKQDSLNDKKELVMVHGKAGTGKTALVMDFRDAVTSTGTGYFCSGKFRQYQGVATPYAAIVQALNDLCEAISVGQDRDQRRQSLYLTLGHARLNDLTKLLPKLKTLLFGSSSKLYSDEDEEGNAAEQEPGPWNDRAQELPTVFRGFLRALSTPSHPIVFFLDDLQWADAASCECILDLIRDVNLRNSMFVCAYRDDPYSQCSLPGDGHGQNLTDMQLHNLTLASVDGILSDLTGTAGVTDLAKIVLEKTYGNPYSIFQFLEMLQRKELLVFSFHTHKWVWDVEKIKSKTEVTPNVGHSLVGNIENLSREGKVLLHLAAVIGFSFDPKILETIALHLELLDDEYRDHLSDAMKGFIEDAVVGGLIHPDQMQAVIASQMELVEDGTEASLRKAFYEETIQAAIQEAEVEGLVGKAAASRSRYKFSHDLVYRSLYKEKIPRVAREQLHLEIGKVLRSYYAVREEDDMLFAAVDHLNRGSVYLPNDSERIDLIELNQKASEKAKARSALFSAADFSKKAIELLKVEHDWTNHYDLLLHVYSEAAELNFACGRFDLSLRRCAEIHRNSRSTTDKLRASYIRIEILHTQRKFEEAIAACLVVLNNLGETINPKPNKGHVLVELRRTKTLLKGFTDDELLSLPPMMDPLKRESMRFLSLLVTLTFHSTENSLSPIVVLRMVRNSIYNGLCNYTPFAIAGYGMLLTVMGSIKEAFNYGSLAMALCRRLKNDICMPGTYLVVFSFLDHLRNPLLGGVEYLLKGYQVGVGNGEVQFAATCMAASAGIGFQCALPLKTYAEDLKNVCVQLKLLKQDLVWSLVAPYWLCALKLCGEATEEQRLTYGNVFGEKNFLNSTGIPETESGLPWHSYYMVSYIVSYIFNNCDSAYEARKDMRRRNNGGPQGLYFIVYLEVFFSGLLDFAHYRKTRKWKSWRQAKQAIRTLARYVKNGIFNCHGMLLLLEAELQSFGRNFNATKKLYDDATKNFSAAGFLHFHAIANERAAEYMLEKKRPCWFETYIRTAAKAYGEWGAVAKVQQLVKKHRLRATFATAEKPAVIRIHNEGSPFVTLIEGHITEELYISSDLIM